MPTPLARASTLILALTLILGSATTATADGDFHFIASCAEEMYGNTNMRLHGRLWINNDLYETWSENYGYVNLDLTQIRPATTSDSIVTCVIEAFYSDAGSWYLLGTYFDSYTIPGMGPRGVEIYSDAFIMAEWVWDPAESSMILSGDYRWYCNQCSTDRISASQTVLNTAVDGSDPPEDGSFSGHGLSEKYDAETSVDWNTGHITPEARQDLEWGWPMKVDWGFSNIDNVYCHSPQRQGATADGTESSLRTVCEGHSSNPVVAFSPDIDYIFLIEVWFGDNHVRYNVDGCRDGFPHFELYIGGNAVIQEGDESNPYGLIGYCGTELHAEGQFTASGNNIIR